MSFPLPTLAAQITATGITAPTYADILSSLQASFQAIYGSDVDLQPDSQDGQLLAIFAQAVYDANQATIATYLGFSPTYGQGAALSAYVKINGLARKVASYSTAGVIIVGVAGTVINSGVVKDDAGNLWNLPTTVTIPSGGSVLVTATAQIAGATLAPAGTIDQIYTPTQGWQSVTNPADAVAGNPIETDAALRIRQAESTSLPAQTPVSAILANVASVPGVGRHAIYENPTGSTDANTVPAHSISVVVEGGDPAAVALAIQQKKSPGTGTYGSTTVAVVDQAGVTININFYQLAIVQIYVAVTIKALSGYVSSTGDVIKQAIADFITALLIGEDVYFTQVYGPGGLYGNPLEKTFKITALAIAITPAPVATADITIAFNQAAACLVANVGLTVT